MIQNKALLSRCATKCQPLAPRPLASRYIATRPAVITHAAAAASAPEPSKTKLPTNPTDLMKTLGDKIPDIKVDIHVLTQYNCYAQVALTAVSWAVVFMSTHAGLAQGHHLNLSTALLMVGLALSAVSAYMAYDYMKKTKADGSAALEGFDAMDRAFDHMKINFAGVIATIFAMQASVGTLFVTAMAESGKLALHMAAASTPDYVNMAAMAQAGANIVTAHVVSLLFLSLIIKKISGQARELVAWGESMRAGLAGLVDKSARM